MNKQELKDKIKLMVKQVSPFTKETSDVLPSSDDISLDDIIDLEDPTDI